MRFIHLGIFFGGALAFGGCAHEQASPPSTATVESYRAVRAGAQPISSSGKMQFCAAEGGVQVISKRASDTSQWADKFRDRDLQSSARNAIARDPALAGQPVSVRVSQGEAIVTGTVQRDADAVIAARDALAVPGVVAVLLQTTSAESPNAPPLVTTSCL